MSETKLNKKKQGIKPEDEAKLNLLEAVAKEIEIDEVKQERVEWFDDRFYKVTIKGKNIYNSLSNIPPEYIEQPAINSWSVYLPSYTTIQAGSKPNPFLAHWRGNVGNIQADYISYMAKQKGANVHDAIERLCQGEEIVFINQRRGETVGEYIGIEKLDLERQCHFLYEQSEMVQVARFKRLIDIINPVILNTEQTVYSLAECYAGTLDAVWQCKAGSYDINPTKNGAIVLEDGFYIIDYKTGNTLDDTGLYCQLAAYLNAHPSKNDIKGALGIHLNNDNKRGIEGIKVYMKTKEELAPYYQHFLDLKKIFFYNNTTRPRNFEIPKSIFLTQTKNNNGTI